MTVLTSHLATEGGQRDSTLMGLLEAQRTAFLRDGPPSRAKRVKNLDALLALVLKYQDRLAECVSEDFGHRSTHETLLAEVLGAIKPIKHARKNLKRWMKPERRPMELELLPARAEIHYQPLGVIGVMAPWNYPFYLTINPLIGALAAGNRVMLKPSELTPRTSQLMKDMLAEAFDDSEVTVVLGGPDVAAAFSSLPFDHLLYTGSTPVGRKVMMAAAENLVPVTLELGGKSPAIVGADYPLKHAASRITFGKLLNAGQTCIAPDYCWVPETKVDEFVDLVTAQASSMYPTLADNPDYTSIVADRHYARIQALIEDAKNKGARVIEVNPAGETVSNQRKIPPTLLLDVTDDMDVMEQEIFGPVLPVKTYSDLDQVIDYVNAHPRPLALYHFSNDNAARARVMERTTAGGVCMNDTLFHVMVEELPFGGVGPSGTGGYHGHYGFTRFSHAKSVFKQSRLNGAGLLNPPYGKLADTMLKAMMWR
ncbi:MAG: coniferyl aldehyde dehydrogenase [Rhodospirillales bacterium]|nr:coniferyl aldehyde dehydrogenase [Rhodospirillales bacterium]